LRKRLYAKYGDTFTKCKNTRTGPSTFLIPTIPGSSNVRHRLIHGQRYHFAGKRRGGATEMIRKKSNVSFILFFIICNLGLLHGERIAAFERKYSSPFLRVEKNYIYIIDTRTWIVDIYSKKNLQFVSHFGGEGQGPGEFHAILNFEILQNSIFINSGTKISYFSKDGKLIREVKTPYNSFGNIQCNENLVCATERVDSDNVIFYDYHLTDSKFNAIKRLYTYRVLPFVVGGGGRKSRNLLIRPKTKVEVYEGQIFIGDSTRGMYFIVFDSNGKKVREISRDFTRIPVTSEVKKSYVAMAGEYFRNGFSPDFPEYFPAFEDFCVTDNRIYVLKHVKMPDKDKTRDVEVLDNMGKCIKKAFVNFDNTYSFDIIWGNYYYLIDNPDTEKWELHYNKIL
jgi:hypothetical protein